MATNTYFGVFQGSVTNVEDPEKRGRLKCKIPTVLGDERESAWCDPMIPVVYDTRGDFCMPFLKETVWVMFIEGDVNRPVWCGGWWSKEKTPLGQNYVKLDDTRIISYKDFSIVIHENEVTISNNSTNSIKMNDDGITITDKFGNTIVMGAGGITETAALGEHHTFGPKIDHN